MSANSSRVPSAALRVMISFATAEEPVSGLCISDGQQRIVWAEAAYISH